MLIMFLVKLSRQNTVHNVMQLISKEVLTNNLGFTMIQK